MTRVYTVAVNFTQQGAQRVVQAIQQIGAGARAANANINFLQRSFNAIRTASGQLVGALTGVFSRLISLRSLFAAYLTLGAARYITNLADAWVLAQNRLAAFITDQKQVIAIQNELFNISQRSRTEFGSTAALYQRLLVSQSSLKLSSQDLLQVTEGLNKAIVISGANASEARAGIVQLAQGIAAGALRGDELRSVLENLPYVAQLIADELSRVKGSLVERGELQRYGAEAKITAKVIVNSVLNGYDTIAARHSRMVYTFDQSFEMLKNSMERLIGMLGQSSGFIPEFTGAVTKIARFVDDIATSVSSSTMDLKEWLRLFDNMNWDFKYPAMDAINQAMKRPETPEERLGLKQRNEPLNPLYLMYSAKEVGFQVADGFREEFAKNTTLGQVIFVMAKNFFKRILPLAIDLAASVLTWLVAAGFKLVLNLVADILPFLVDILVKAAEIFGEAIANSLAKAVGPKIRGLLGIAVEPEDERKKKLDAAKTSIGASIYNSLNEPLVKAMADSSEKAKVSLEAMKGPLDDLIGGFSALAKVILSGNDAVDKLRPKIGTIINASEASKFQEILDDIAKRLKAVKDLSRDVGDTEKLLDASQLANNAFNRDRVIPYTPIPNTLFGAATLPQEDPGMDMTKYITYMDEYGIHVDMVRYKQDLLAKSMDELAKAESMRQMVLNLGETVGQTFEDIIFQVDSLGEAIESMVKNVAKIIFQEMVTKQIAGFASSMIGAGFGLPSSGPGSVKGYANGGIIDRPTWLGLAGGIPAMGGESGPEAVVPLPDGRRIPVMLQGGGGGGNGGGVTNINMTVHTPDADSFRRSSRQITDDVTRQMRRRR